MSVGDTEIFVLYVLKAFNKKLITTCMTFYFGIDETITVICVVFT